MVELREAAVLNVAISGLGRWGQTLVRAVQSEGMSRGKLIQVVSGYTRTPSKVQEFADLEKIAMYSTLEDLLASKTAQALIVASPHSQHVSQIKAAAAAGLHVFTEKPLALDVESALDAIEACRRANVVLAVGFNRRFLPAYLQLQELVQSEALGRLLHLEGNFSGPFGLSYKSDVWHANRAETPAGGMTLMGVHVLDAMIGLAGPISKVNARSRQQHLRVDLDDTTDATLEFARGCTGYLSTITATARQWRLQVFGTDGWAQMTDQDRMTISIIGRDVEDIKFPAVSTERAELEAFARAVAGLEKYPVPPLEAANGIASLQAIRTSAEANQETIVKN
jgi:predicted dehydrogenase